MVTPCHAKNSEGAALLRSVALSGAKQGKSKVSRSSAKAMLGQVWRSKAKAK